MDILFCDPKYQGGGFGSLLSRARLLFMAQHPQRFSNTIFSELRGVHDEKGISPFWQCLGAYFFPISFSEADELTVLANKQFIADLMPRGKIYLPLLQSTALLVRFHC